jgi:hypothetical protein
MMTRLAARQHQDTRLRECSRLTPDSPIVVTLQDVHGERFRPDVARSGGTDRRARRQDRPRSKWRVANYVARTADAAGREPRRAVGARRAPLGDAGVRGAHLRLACRRRGDRRAGERPLEGTASAGPAATEPSCRVEHFVELRGRRRTPRSSASSASWRRGSSNARSGARRPRGDVAGCCSCTRSARRRSTSSASSSARPSIPASRPWPASSVVEIAGDTSKLERVDQGQRLGQRSGGCRLVALPRDPGDDDGSCDHGKHDRCGRFSAVVPSRTEEEQHRDAPDEQR